MMNQVKIVAFVILCFFSCIAASASGIELEKKSLLNNQIELKIPKGFTLMSEKILKVKYPMERRPTLVYTDQTGGINVALNLTENQVNQALMSSYTDNFVQSFKQVYASAKWKGSGVKTINGRQVGYLELVTPALDTNIYNLMVFTDLHGKLLICSFNCTEKSIKDWESIAKEIMQSLIVKN